ncbi:hypothetical protein [Massilia sp. LC238]|uniref:hypothetical protein n=1 Tax=Massilia sp. LC238 TaxID=1502852 RepID=UPI001E2A15ED|nr:hypothetical protein [Massilia sp. LC238]
MRHKLAALLPVLAALSLAALLALLGAGPAASAPASRPAAVGLLTIDGAIGPASADQVVRGIARSASLGHALLVIRMDTPGGLDTSMRTAIKAILAAPVPVAVYVAPSGARAASAGTYLLYASHVAAMAPGTNVGAATPVEIGIGPSPPRRPARARRQRQGRPQGRPKGGLAHAGQGAQRCRRLPARPSPAARPQC